MRSLDRHADLAGEEALAVGCEVDGVACADRFHLTRGGVEWTCFRGHLVSADLG